MSRIAGHVCYLLLLVSYCPEDHDIPSEKTETTSANEAAQSIPALKDVPRHPNFTGFACHVEVEVVTGKTTYIEQFI